MTLYRAREGDVLDAICWNFYGKTAGVVELVLEANPGLAALGPIYDAGVLIVLPELPAPIGDDYVRLWS